MKRDIKKLATIMIVGAISIVPVAGMANSMDITNLPITNTSPVKDMKVRFIEKSAKVLEINENSAGIEALVKVGDVNYRLNLPKDLLVVNQGKAQIGSIQDIAKDSEISFYITEKTPMGMSDPAFLTPEFVIANLGEKSHTVSKFDKEFLGQQNELKLNMDENTQIIPQNGEKIKLQPESIIDKEAIVIYSVTTRSIPPQTNPELVVLLNEEETMTETPKDDVVETPKEDSAMEVLSYQNASGIKMTGFAATATNLGYEVSWDEMNKTAIATSGEHVIKVSLKSNTVNINGKDLKVAYPIETKEGRLYIADDAYANIFLVTPEV